MSQLVAVEEGYIMLDKVTAMYIRETDSKTVLVVGSGKDKDYYTARVSLDQLIHDIIEVDLYLKGIRK